MRVGIITYHRSINYGGFLQTYALCRYLQTLGHNVRVVDYDPPHRDDKARPWDRRLLGLHPQNAISLYKRKCFGDSIRRYLPLTECSYRTLDDLRRAPPEADAYVCGSDQIWNPLHTGGAFDPAYFGRFGGPHIKRIAYAPSMGSRGVPGQYRQSLADNLAGLDHLSARERSACDLITSVTGRPCAHVVDPTFLVSDYSELTQAAPLHTKPYILVYDLTYSSWLRRILSIIRPCLRIPLVFVVNSFKLWQYGSRFRLCTPRRWLTLIAHSQGVITDSFHGTAVALQFRKPFLSAGLSDSVEARNIRITELLHTFGLSDRFVGSEAALENTRLIMTDPDWAAVQRRMAILIVHARGYISRALGATQPVPAARR